MKYALLTLHVGFGVACSRRAGVVIEFVLTNSSNIRAALTVSVESSLPSPVLLMMWARAFASHAIIVGTVSEIYMLIVSQLCCMSFSQEDPDGQWLHTTRKLMYLVETLMTNRRGVAIST